MSIRRTSALLAAILVLSVSACSQAPQNQSSDSSAPVSSSDTATTDNSSAPADIESAEQDTATDDSPSVITTDSQTTTETTTETTEAFPEVWNPEVIQRDTLLDNGYICGVVQLGFVEGEATAEDCRKVYENSVYTEDFEFITDIPDENIIDTGYANELYLIIPQDTNASVAVNEWLMTEENDFMGEAGQVFYKSDIGAPILLKCNFSDIMPNTVVNIVNSNGRTLQWSPSISLKDGSISRYGVEDDVCDMTHYIYNETYECYIVDNGTDNG